MLKHGLDKLYKAMAQTLLAQSLFGMVFLKIIRWNQLGV